MEPYEGLLGSRQNCTGFYANGIPRCSALGHWGLTQGDKSYGLTSGDWGTRVCYPTKPGVAKEGECRPKEASQSS